MRLAVVMRGFTLVELIVIMVVMGIMAIVAMPRFLDNTVSERGAHDGFRVAIEYARRSAVASRRYVCVVATPGTGAEACLAVSMETTAPEAAAGNVACAVLPLPVGAVALPLPGATGAAANQVCAARGVIVSEPVAGGGSVIFNPSGLPVTAARAALAVAPTLSVSGQPTITVNPTTGWVQ